MAFNSEFSVLSSTIKNVIVELKMAAMFLDCIMQNENMVSGGGEWRGAGRGGVGKFELVSFVCDNFWVVIPCC